MKGQKKVIDVQELLDLIHVKSSGEVERLVARSSLEFKGQADDLYMAVGCLLVGRLYGWRVLRLTLTSKQYAKYQRILALGLDEPGGGFRFGEWMRERERLSYKSIGLKLADMIGDFWAACKGCIAELPLAKRRDVGA